MIKKLFLILITLAILVGIGLVIFKKNNASFLTPIFGLSNTKQLIENLSKNGINLNSPPIELNGSIEASISGIKVIFSPDKDLGLQIRTLQVVLPKARMSDKDISEIDLRFAKVVIKYE